MQKHPSALVGNFVSEVVPSQQKKIRKIVFDFFPISPLEKVSFHFLDSRNSHVILEIILSDSFLFSVFQKCDTQEAKEKKKNVKSWGN